MTGTDPRAQFLASLAGRPLLDLLPDTADDERFAFVEHGYGVIGWGVAGRIAVGTGPGRYGRARSGVQDLIGGLQVETRVVDAEDVPASDAADARTGGTPLTSGRPMRPTRPNAGPVAFASFTFDEDDDASVVVVPRVVVGRQDGRTWVTTIGTDSASIDTALTTAGTGADSVSRPLGRASERDRPRHAGSTLRDDAWLDAVGQVLENIEAGKYAKVVLARDLHLWSRAPFDVTGLLHALADRFPSCATFLVDHLVGASPEQLVRLMGRDVSARVLAGTVGRGGDAQEDAQFGAALLASRKDRHEHDLALRSATEALAQCCGELDVPDEPSLMVLDNVQHLGTDLTGMLAGSGHPVDVLDLVERLHPTAAVCGTPREAALRAIRALEGMPRGRYAGPVGWFTPDGDGEFAIALRCAEVHGERARLFAGAGVVAGSLPEAELTETWLKLQAMTAVLEDVG